MLEQLFQTVTSFFFDGSEILNLIDSIKSGQTDILGGFISMVRGLFTKGTDA